MAVINADLSQEIRIEVLNLKNYFYEDDFMETILTETADRQMVLYLLQKKR